MARWGPFSDLGLGVYGHGPCLYSLHSLRRAVSRQVAVRNAKVRSVGIMSLLVPRSIDKATFVVLRPRPRLLILDDVIDF